MGWDGREGGDVLGGGMWGLLKGYEGEVVVLEVRGWVVVPALLNATMLTRRAVVYPVAALRSHYSSAEVEVLDPYTRTPA